MGSKDLLGSISFWGPLLMVLQFIGNAFGFDVGSIIGDASGLANSFAMVGAFLLSLFGVLKRKDTISSVAGMPNPLAPK